MITYKCKICGGSLDINSGDSFFTCQYCGSQLALPRLNNSRTVNLYERANHLLQCNEFDKASSLYEELILEDNTDCEAYWSLVLCRFGVMSGEKVLCKYLGIDLGNCRKPFRAYTPEQEEILIRTYNENK